MVIREISGSTAFLRLIGESKRPGHASIRQTDT